MKIDLLKLRDEVRKDIHDALKKGWKDKSKPRDFESELITVKDVSNRWAERLGAEPVTLEQVETIDRMAAGHVDWCDKLTLRTADLVVYGSPGQP